MRREIKFRAFNYINKWLYGYLSKDALDTYYITSPDGIDTSIVDINTVCQFTGIEDKNGVDIYEGDIIRYNFQTTFSNDEFISQVIFDEFMFMTDEHSLNRCSNIEVIGNIHSNPELL